MNFAIWILRCLGFRNAKIHINIHFFAKSLPVDDVERSVDQRRINGDAMRASAPDFSLIGKRT